MNATNEVETVETEATAEPENVAAGPYATFDLKGTLMDPNTWSTAYKDYMFKYAAGVIVQRCTASVKGNIDPSKGPITTDKEAQDAAIARTLENIQAGRKPVKGAGGGVKADPEVKAARVVVASVLHNSFGYGKTEAAKVAKDDPWNVLFAHYVREEAKESGEQLDDDAIAKLATDENIQAVMEMHKKEYETALAVAKGGSKKVVTTGFLKKN